MNEIRFSKYQGTGNDFVLIDQRSERWLARKDTATVRQLCDRRFGIGADGLILLQNVPGFDFEMIYFNSDGRESTMCGNGGRCIVAFAKRLGIVERNCRFLAIDGMHEAIVSDDWVELKMADVASVETGDGFFVLDTGSPHYVVFVEDLSDIDIVQNGQAIRYSDSFRKDGINVNFVEKTPAGIEVATYERGVEAETLSCGTGVTAAALAWFLSQPQPTENEVVILTKGGKLKVRFKPDGQGGFSDVWLCGPARAVFDGKISI